MAPLSDAALAVLAKAAAFRLGESDVVFPGVAGKPMSDMTLLKVLRDMSEPYHVHGFRSAFTDWAANEGFADAVVEAALAHKTPDAVQAAYRRTTYLGTPDKPGARVELMAAWGRYCASGAVGTDNVVPLAGKKGGIIPASSYAGNGCTALGNDRMRLTRRHFHTMGAPHLAPDADSED